MVLLACQSENTIVKYDRSIIPYNLSTPDTLFIMPDALQEISGITFWDQNLLAAIEDEHGIIYFISTRSGQVERKIRFEKDGDYEDITAVDSIIYVLKSDGEIFKIEDFESNNLSAKKFKNHLSAKNNTEGLCYIPSKQILWIACKESAKKNSKSRSIFSFNLSTDQLSAEEIFTIKYEEANQFYQAKYQTEKELVLMPSAIAVHPVNNDIYILSGPAKLLIILGSTYDVKEIVKLPTFYATQAEGIAFTPDGDLFIASEGKGAKATIAYFKNSYE